MNYVKLWNKYGFEITVVGTICIILFLSLFNRDKGSWFLYYPQKSYNQKNYNSSYSVKKRGPPKESKGEIECKRVLEKIFRVSFDKYRPDFLRNTVTSLGLDENNLELDCYNPDLRLAVEYNGVQHYKYIPFFHKTKDSFYNQRYRDYMKRELCDKNGIVLIEVPYTVKVEEIEEYLIKKLQVYKYL